MHKTSGNAEQLTGSDLLKVVSGLKEFFISIVDERIEQKLKENTSPEKETKDLVLYTVKEVCERLKIGRTTLYTLCHKKGGLKFHRIGRRILFSKEDIISALTNIKKYERLP